MREIVRIVIASAVLLLSVVADADEKLRLFGFAAVDVTPSTAVRLSGYGSRDRPYEAVDTPLHARAMVVREVDGTTLVLVAVDTIGFTAKLTNEIHGLVEAKHGVPRSRFVICGTHTHNAPHLSTGLDNLFSVELTDEERRNAVAYTEQVRDGVVKAVDEAVVDLSPGQMAFAEGEVTFAQNRRVIKDGVWAGFGITPGGQVDHAFPLLKVTDAGGEKVRGLVFNYACHCTSLGALNHVNGDWAGYASTTLEKQHPGAVAVCCIGCGADANPPRTNNPAMAIQYAEASAAEIVDEVDALNAGSMTDVPAASSQSFGFVGLPIRRPEDTELKEALKDSRPQLRRHAEMMLEIKKRKGRLPASYPMPIQVWRFGDEFTMVFLGGEVVADYSHRIKKELPGTVWVSAYSNDVFGYVASEAMQSEGGYEVDYSMIYYGQPGRWESGTEDLILKRVHELYENANPSEPLSVNDALDTFQVPQGFTVDVVAAEPLIRDPATFAVGPDGRLWVVEMGDYPNGAEEGGHVGRIQVLSDTDGDGRYDVATTFLDDLAFPTGVFPFGDGAYVMASPDLIYASDADGDGVAEKSEVLWTGFNTHNPQHLMNNFTYGLDHRLYLAGGTTQPIVRKASTAETLNISRRDARLDLRSGKLVAVSGQSQYGRSRDDWGHWFGNSNSEPLHQYAVDDTDLARNPYVASPSARVELAEPPIAPPVYPTSKTIDRFNDLYSANRFTSACAPTIFRDAMVAGDADLTAFICEPVHNLVSRLLLTRDGLSFLAKRHADEPASEFFTSTDNWCRPVFAQTGPDGSLWVADMYRAVIEHPQWIPDSWQTSLDLSAGNRMGRIYRVRRSDQAVVAVPNLTQQTSAELVANLSSSNGWIRDTSQQLLIEREDLTVVDSLHALVQGGESSIGRLHALWTLFHMKQLIDADLQAVLTADHVGLVRAGLEVGAMSDPTGKLWLTNELADHDDVEVRYALALAAGECADAERRLPVLKELCRRGVGDRWMRAAVVSSSVGCAFQLFGFCVAELPESEGRAELTSALIATAMGEDDLNGAAHVLMAVVPREGQEWTPRRLMLIANVVEAIEQLGKTHLIRDRRQGVVKRIDELCAEAFKLAREVVGDDDVDVNTRVAAARLLGRNADEREADSERLLSLLDPRSPRELQSAALSRLLAIGGPDRLLAEYTSLTPAGQRELLTAVLTRGDGVLKLIQAIEKRTIEPSQVDASTRDMLLHHPSQRIQRRAVAALGSDAGDRTAIVQQYAAALQLDGNSQHGRQLFEKRCSTCHQHQGLGKAIGPQLSALQNKSVDYFLTAVLDPNLAVEGKYRAYAVTTTSGLVYSGMVIDESATSIALAQADGKAVTVLRRDIDSISSGRSFMPEGLEKDLSVQDMADLLAFVAGVKL